MALEHQEAQAQAEAHMLDRNAITLLKRVIA
jgi:hypothetical protein